MNEIHAAYQKLGAHPGTEFEVIKRRYKMLVMVWHPDRLTTPEGKRIAEEELKSINNAFACLKKHFESGHHQELVCECQREPVQKQQTGAGHNESTGYEHKAGSGQTGSNQNYSNPGGHEKEKTAHEKWAEQESQTQESKRCHAEEAAHEAAFREAIERARQATAAKAKAQTAATSITEEQLRWRISIALAAIFVFLLIGGLNKKFETRVPQESEFSLSSKVPHF